ncbi:hypothetical protein [Pseudonocardia acaciae]|uniref:hypothetical protein n=1 Tax=Pseudonocardia acaciae TaxID=551276 RepID=UPI00055FAFB5|nr:hypothetical protein [Pseudonocardia acaciae]
MSNGVVVLVVAVTALAGWVLWWAFRAVWSELRRMAGIALAAVVSAALITAVQWAVVSRMSDPIVVGLVLGLPALLAGASVGRVLESTTWIRISGGGRHGRRGVRR